MNELLASLNLIISQTKNNAEILGIILLIPWSFFFITRFISEQFLLLGIIPRRIYGVLGIIFAPVLHSDFNHLFFNSIPLLVLSNFLLVNGLHYYLYVTVCITLLSGIAIWCFAKPGLHIGASALITGYFSFLLCEWYRHPSTTLLILGLLSIYYFSGLFFGIFPTKRGVSWEGHLFGLIAGAVTSIWLV